MTISTKWLVLLVAVLQWLICFRATAQFYPVPTVHKSSSPSQTGPTQIPKTIAWSALMANLDLGTRNLNDLAEWNITLTLDPGASIQSVEIESADGGTVDTSSSFKAEYALDCTPKPAKGQPCSPPTYNLAVGFVPTQTGTATAKLEITINTTQGTGYTAVSKTIVLSGKGIGTNSLAKWCLTPDRNWLPTSKKSNSIAKTGDEGIDELDQKLGQDFDAWAGRQDNIVNCYYNSNNMATLFTQVQSIFDAAAGSTNIQAEVATLNFTFGPQVSVGTNYQAGNTASNMTTAPSPNSAIPTLAATNAAQAAQNLLWGGNVYLYAFLPIFANLNAAHDRWNFNSVVSVREGVDVQNFSGATTTATNPTTHFGVQGEGYAQFDGIPAIGSSDSPGSFFVGGRYGYAYTANQYRKQYGFSSTNARVGQVSFGFKLSEVKIAAFKSFGPSQTYVDSSTNVQTTQNNFHSLSFAISYQK